MRRSNVFVKIEIEHEREENPSRIGEEICRQIAKLYGVRLAEVTNVSTEE